MRHTSWPSSSAPTWCRPSAAPARSIGKTLTSSGRRARRRPGADPVVASVNRVILRKQTSLRGILRGNMPYVITEACINTKDKACVDVCPVDCIYEGEQQLYINPDECIDCGACEPECPVTAIFPEEDVPGQLKQYIEKNKTVFQSPNPPGRPKK